MSIWIPHPGLHDFEMCTWKTHSHIGNVPKLWGVETPQQGPENHIQHIFVQGLFRNHSGGAPKERRRRRAEKRSSKRVFWRVRFFSAPLRFSDVLRANLNGGQKKRTLQKHPFGRPFPRTTPSPLLWRALTFRSWTSAPQIIDICATGGKILLIP